MADKKGKSDAKLHTVANLAASLQKQHRIIADRYTDLQKKITEVGTKATSGPAADAQINKLVKEVEEVATDLETTVDDMCRSLRAMKKDLAAAKAAADGEKKK